MFSHIMLGSHDIARSKAFYDAVLETLGVRAGKVDGSRVFWKSQTGMFPVFSVTLPINGEAASVGNGGTVGFMCSSPEQVDAWHAAGVANGGQTCEDPPGVREGRGGRAYVAYLRDPDGNKLCGYHPLPRA